MFSATPLGAGIGRGRRIASRLMARSRRQHFLIALLLAAAPLPTPAAVWIKGCDVSSLAKSEALGGVYRDRAGATGDALAVLGSHGVNVVRLKVWVDSPDGYHGTPQILALADRAHAAGQQVLLTFHYSDSWADPGQQTKPAAWASLSPEALRAAVYTHTYALCAALAAQGTPAGYVQVGNEINDGLLWPEGRLSAHSYVFGAVAPYLQAGIAAVRAASPTTAVVLHIARGAEWGQVQWWFDGMRAAGVSWDYTGLSYYPYWHGSLSALEYTVTQAAARYERPVLLCETGYPFTLGWADAQSNLVGTSGQLTEGFPATVEGQAAMLRAIFQIMDRVPAGRGAGVVYWEGTWTPVAGNGWNNYDPSSGNSWENQALFDFAGQALGTQLVFGEFLGLAAAHFTPRELADPAISGDLADPDHDGTSNLLELALALDPRCADAALQPKPAWIETDGRRYLALTFHRPARSAGLVYRVESATGSPAGPWSEDTIAVGDPVEVAPGKVAVTHRSPHATDAADGRSGFLRVAVARAPVPAAP